MRTTYRYLKIAATMRYGGVQRVKAAINASFRHIHIQGAVHTMDMYEFCKVLGRGTYEVLRRPLIVS